MELGLAGRVYVVTGGSRGLGRATAEALVDEGAKVVISSRSATKVDEAVAALGSNACGLALDNANEDAPRALIEAARSRFGDLHGALISVGGPDPGAQLTTTDAQWRSAFETIFLGAVRLATQVAAQLAPGGAIGLVLSSSVKTPIGHLPISNGLRPGLAMFVKDLADEVGPSGVRVFGLIPGRILTDRGGRDLDERVSEQLNRTIPLQRAGRAEEFGAVAAMMLSPRASYVSGCMIPIDGGSMRAL